MVSVAYHKDCQWGNNESGYKSKESFLFFPLCEKCQSFHLTPCKKVNKIIFQNVKIFNSI